MHVQRHTLTAAGFVPAGSIQPGQTFSYVVSGTFTGYVLVEISHNRGQSWELFDGTVVDTGCADILVNESMSDIWMRFSAHDTDAETAFSGTALAVLSVGDATEFAAWLGEATVIASESPAAIQRTVLHLNNFAVTVGNTTGVSFGGAKLFDFPAGRILVMGATANLSFDWSASDIAAAGTGDFSLGTTITADATLNGTDVNLLPSTGLLDPFVDGVGTGSGALAASAQFDGTATAIDCNLNLIIDDADVEDATEDVVLVTGTVTLTWVNLGDY
jgi:hypothetical protein